MDARLVAFGRIEIDGRAYDRDVVIERGDVRRRKKGPSKPFQSEYGHTPVSVDESIPWSVRRLIIGTGAEGRLPITPEVHERARERGVELVAVPTAEACALLADADPTDTGAILHVTC
jgi:hypothetical protein